MGIIFTVSDLVFTVGLMSSGVLGTLSQGEDRAGSSARVFNTFESVFNLVQTGSNLLVKDATYKSMVKYLKAFQSVFNLVQTGSMSEEGSDQLFLSNRGSTVESNLFESVLNPRFLGV